MSNKTFILIGGVSGAGKDHLSNLLCENHADEFSRLMQVTTRQPRDNEREHIGTNKTYSFIDEAIYGHLKPCLIATTTFDGNFYGTISPVLRDNEPEVFIIIVNAEGLINAAADLKRIYDEPVNVIRLGVMVEEAELDLDDRKSRKGSYDTEKGVYEHCDVLITRESINEDYYGAVNKIIADSQNRVIELPPCDKRGCTNKATTSIEVPTSQDGAYAHNLCASCTTAFEHATMYLKDFVKT